MSFSTSMMRYCRPSSHQHHLRESVPCPGSSCSFVASAAAKLLSCHSRRQRLERLEIAQPGRRQIERVGVRIDADDDARAVPGITRTSFSVSKTTGAPAGIRLQPHRRGGQHRLVRGFGQLEHDRHARRPRRLAAHGEPVEKAAPHLLAGAVEPFGDFRS